MMMMISMNKVLDHSRLIFSLMISHEIIIQTCRSSSLLISSISAKSMPMLRKDSGKFRRSGEKNEGREKVEETINKITIIRGRVEMDGWMDG